MPKHIQMHDAPLLLKPQWFKTIQFEFHQTVQLMHGGEKKMANQIPINQRGEKPRLPPCLLLHRSTNLNTTTLQQSFTIHYTIADFPRRETYQLPKCNDAITFRGNFNTSHVCSHHTICLEHVDGGGFLPRGDPH